MASLVDDDVSANEFREQLGNFELGSAKQAGHAKQSKTQRNKAVTLITGTR